MSQEKVERRKYEKYNRKKLERQRKIKLTIKCVVAAVIVGAIIGIPTGINYYKNLPKFVGDSTLSAFVDNYINEAHASDLPNFTSEDATTEETKEEKVTDAIEDATGSDVETVDEDNIDEVLGTDDTTTETASETSEE